MNVDSSETPGQQLPEITNQMLRLGEKIDHLGNAVEILGKRLTPLLTPSPDAPAQNMVTAKSINSPLTDNLRALSSKVESISEEVQEMLNALEI